MRRPYFVADAASVTVLHSVASSAFGKYSLTVPEGVDIDDMYKLSALKDGVAGFSSRPVKM